MRLYQLEADQFEGWLKGKKALSTTEPSTVHEHGDNQYPIAIAGSEIRLVTSQWELNWLKSKNVGYSWYSILSAKCEPVFAREMQNAV